MCSVQRVVPSFVPPLCTSFEGPYEACNVEMKEVLKLGRQLAETLNLSSTKKTALLEEMTIRLVNMDKRHSDSMTTYRLEEKLSLLSVMLLNSEGCDLSLDVKLDLARFCAKLLTKTDIFAELQDSNDHVLSYHDFMALIAPHPTPVPEEMEINRRHYSLADVPSAADLCGFEKMMEILSSSDGRKISLPLGFPSTATYRNKLLAVSALPASRRLGIDEFLEKDNDRGWIKEFVLRHDTPDKRKFFDAREHVISFREMQGDNKAMGN